VPRTGVALVRLQEHDCVRLVRSQKVLFWQSAAVLQRPAATLTFAGRWDAATEGVRRKPRAAGKRGRGGGGERVPARQRWQASL